MRFLRLEHFSPITFTSAPISLTNFNTNSCNPDMRSTDMRKFSILQSQYLQIFYFFDQRTSQLKLTRFTWVRFKNLLIRISGWETDTALNPELLNVALFWDSLFNRSAQLSSDMDVLHKFTFSKYWRSKLDPTLGLVNHRTVEINTYVSARASYRHYNIISAVTWKSECFQVHQWP
jgi:hypothetical protein